MKYFIGFVVTIFLIILTVILLVTGGDDKKAKVPVTAKTLDSYSTTSATMRMTIDGPVQADQTHQQVRVTVGQNEARFEQIDGYNGNVVNTKSYVNNTEAYATFLHALARANYTKRNTDKALQDERGICALGDRYIFEIEEDGRELQRSWTTSCNKTKTFLGERNLVIQLFQAQIPDYSKLMRPVTGL